MYNERVDLFVMNGLWLLAYVSVIDFHIFWGWWQKLCYAYIDFYRMHSDFKGVWIYMSNNSVMTITADCLLYSMNVDVYAFGWQFHTFVRLSFSYHIRTLRAQYIIFSHAVYYSHYQILFVTFARWHRYASMFADKTPINNTNEICYIMWC